MNFILNGKAQQINDSTTIWDLLSEKSINHNTVVVEHNGKILEHTQWQKTLINQDDNLEVLKFVGGGSQ